MFFTSGLREANRLDAASNRAMVAAAPPTGQTQRNAAVSRDEVGFLDRRPFDDKHADL